MLWIYNVDLQVKVLAVSYLDAAQRGSLESMGAKGNLQAGSISLRTFCLYLYFLPGAKAQQVGYFYITSRGDTGVDRLRN